MRVDDGLVLRGKGTSPADTSPLAMLTGDHAYEIEVDVSVQAGVEAGLLLFFNNRLFCGMGIDGERMLSYSGGIRTHWREPAPATDRITLRIRNDEHIVTGWYRVPGGEWTRHAIRYETSGYHANTTGDLLSLRPALYATGQGEARFRDFRYRSLPDRPPHEAPESPRPPPGQKRTDHDRARLSRRTAVDPLDRSAVRAPPRGRARAARRRAGVQLRLVLAEGDRGLVRARPTRRRQRRALARELGAERARRGHVRLLARRHHARRGPHERASPGAALVRRLQERGVDLRAHVGARQPGTVPARRGRTEGHAGLQLRGGDGEAGALGLQPGAARSRREGLRGAHPAPRRCRSATARSSWCRSRTSLVCSRTAATATTLAEAAWSAPGAVRADRARARDAGGNARPAATLWESHGSVESGSWPQVFGDTARGRGGLHGVGDRQLRRAPRRPRPGDRRPPDVRERVARSAARSGHPRPVPERRARHPPCSTSGEPRHRRSRSSDPTSTCDDADAAMAQYATGIQPFFVPECRLSAGRTRPCDRRVRGRRLVGVRARRRQPRCAARGHARVRRRPRGRDRGGGAPRDASAPSCSSPASRSRAGTSTASTSRRAARARSSSGCCSMPGCTSPTPSCRCPMRPFPNAQIATPRRDAAVRPDRRNRRRRLRRGRTRTHAGLLRRRRAGRDRFRPGAALRGRPGRRQAVCSTATSGCMILPTDRVGRRPHPARASLTQRTAAHRAAREPPTDLRDARRDPTPDHSRDGQRQSLGVGAVGHRDDEIARSPSRSDPRRPRTRVRPGRRRTRQAVASPAATAHPREPRRRRTGCATTATRSAQVDQHDIVAVARPDVAHGRSTR